MQNGKDSKGFSLWRPHPWHGLEAGPEPPVLVNAYVEITPFDFVKYEVDKATGYLHVDRPYRTSSQPPALYGFIPRTLCGDRVRDLSPLSLRGDHDPLDICIVSERPITKSEIVLTAKVIGGLQMIDNDEADDKIIAVLQNDFIWNRVEDVEALPPVLLERLEHYFSTYKLVVGQESRVSIESVYNSRHARNVVAAAIEDYREVYGEGS